MSEAVVLPAVIEATTFAGKILQARPATVQYLCWMVATEAFSQVWTTKLSRKTAVEITAGWALFLVVVKILFFRMAYSIKLSPFCVLHLLLVPNIVDYALK